ncbi:hypothetical protein D3C81_606380 [compost metagenome]
MDKQVKLIDADKLQYWLSNKMHNTGSDSAYYALEALLDELDAGTFNPDPIPPTIKQGESHPCPKCGNHNCFVTPINELNAEWFMCSFCNKPSPKEEWMEVSHD